MVECVILHDLKQGVAVCFVDPPCDMLSFVNHIRQHFRVPQYIQFFNSFGLLTHLLQFFVNFNQCFVRRMLKPNLAIENFVELWLEIGGVLKSQFHVV